MRRGMIDCCMFVQKCQYEDHKRIILKISWYLRKGLRPMGFSERITIYKDNMDGWYEVTDDTAR